MNGHDRYEDGLPLKILRAKVGTLAMWKKELDPFISVLHTSSPAIIPLLLKKPGVLMSIHIGIYQPTKGREDNFILALAALTSVLDFAHEHHAGAPIYIRGDDKMSTTSILAGWLISPPF